VELRSGTSLDVKNHGMQDKSLSSIWLVSPMGQLTGAARPLVARSALPGPSGSGDSAQSVAWCSVVAGQASQSLVQREPPAGTVHQRRCAALAWVNENTNNQCAVYICFFHYKHI
jgi:hypothetical protein